MRPRAFERLKALVNSWPIHGCFLAKVKQTCQLKSALKAVEVQKFKQMALGLGETQQAFGRNRGVFYA